ncbi:MAG TPA: metallophosphoesterase [Vicinamibacterales bacterium]|jgi:predicted phosphodiesterase|nr:metallophosphoesterase [Vicinamibacterales bacterium]
MHSRSHTRFVIALALFVGAIGAPAAQDVSLPNQPDSLKFAIIGDSGTGSSSQYKVAEMLIAARAKFPYEFVLMMGDNLYSGSGPKDYQKKFEVPYKALLDTGLKFYAALGNHDNTDEKNYKPFNMGGQRYYTFKPKNGVRVFALDTNYMDQPQLQWLEKELTASGSDWKVVFFHHPLYSSGGTHGSDFQLRAQLEPMFLKHGVDVVFSGHEHFYERIKPQKGIYYFTSGGAAKLRDGDVKKTELTAKSFDSGYHFMLIEITKDTMYFQAISDQGKIVDSGALSRFSDQDKKKFATP